MSPNLYSYGSTIIAFLHSVGVFSCGRSRKIEKQTDVRCRQIFMTGGKTILDFLNVGDII